MKINSLYARNNPFPEEWIEELEQGLEVISPREHLEADVAHYATERKTYLDLLKKNYLEDTAATAYQSYTQLLEAETDAESQYELVFAKLANNDFNGANSTLAVMQPSDEEAVIKHNQITALLPVLNHIDNDEISWEDLDITEKELIIDLSDNNNELSGMLAKSVRMKFDTSYVYDEPIYTDSTQELRMAMPKNNNKQNTKSDIQSFKVSPNPANDYVIVEYTYTNAKEILLMIYDMQGRLQLTQPVKNSTNQTIIDLRKLINGTYQCKLMIDGQNKSVVKLIVQH